LSGWRHRRTTPLLVMVCGLFGAVVVAIALALGGSRLVSP
jgi:hypothetical protein